VLLPRTDPANDNALVKEVHADVWSRTQRMVDELVEEWSHHHGSTSMRDGAAA